MSETNQSEKFAEIGRMPVSKELKLPCDVLINGGRTTIPKGASLETLMNVFSIICDQELSEQELVGFAFRPDYQKEDANIKGIAVPGICSTDWTAHNTHSSASVLMRYSGPKMIHLTVDIESPAYAKCNGDTDVDTRHFDEICRDLGITYKRMKGIAMAGKVYLYDCNVPGDVKLPKYWSYGIDDFILTQYFGGK